MKRQRLVVILAVSFFSFGALASAARAGVLINFDSLNSRPNGVGGAVLDNYLAGFGLAISHVTTGTQVLVEDDRDIYPDIQPVIAPSPHNVITQVGLNTAISYRVDSSSPLNSFSFVRPIIRAGVTGVALPQWSAHALDANGVELGVVGESARSIFVDIPAASFTLTGPNIASVRFDANAFNFAAFSSMPFDNFEITSVPEPGTLVLAGAGALGLVGYRRWRRRLPSPGK